MLFKQNGATNLRRILVERVGEANALIIICCGSIGILFPEPIYHVQLLELALPCFL